MKIIPVCLLISLTCMPFDTIYGAPQKQPDIVVAGGSSIWGNGFIDEETPAGFLQKEYDTANQKHEKH